METIDSMLFVLRPRAGQRGRHLQAQRGQRFGQAFAQRGGRSSVQVRPGTERHGALDRIESDKDELLRDQYDLRVWARFVPTGWITIPLRVPATSR